jgi:hypothetical protein
MWMINGIVRETEWEMGNIGGCGSALSAGDSLLFLYIFLAGYSVSATPLLMSPISDF